MYYFLSLLMGILISVMVAFNGGLTAEYGVYGATVIIHITGLLLISAIVLFNRENPFSSRQAWYLYLGGAIGVLTTIFNNLAFGRISVSAILALGLLGQSIAGLVIDQYGLFGMEKYLFNRKKIIGLILILLGIGAMINNFEIIAVVVSFIAGINIALSRTLNAKLSDHTSVRVSTFFNYFIGLGLSVLAFAIISRNESVFTNFTISPHLFIYFGGILGVCVVLMGNITALKISAFYLTLLIFVGQVFSGVLIDIIIAQVFSPRNFFGGTLVALGLCVNLLLDRSNSV